MMLGSVSVQRMNESTGVSGIGEEFFFAYHVVGLHLHCNHLLGGSFLTPSLQLQSTCWRLNLNAGALSSVVNCRWYVQYQSNQIFEGFDWGPIFMSILPYYRVP